MEAEAFIRIFQKAATKSDVAKAAGVSIAAVDKRARYYRAKGIGLRYFRKSQRLNVAHLKRIAQSLQGRRKR